MNFAGAVLYPRTAIGRLLIHMPRLTQQFLFQKGPPPAEPRLSIFYITVHHHLPTFLLAHKQLVPKKENTSTNDAKHLEQTIGNTKLTAQDQHSELHVFCLESKHFHHENHRHPELYMYSRHGQRSRYGPPPKLDTFRLLRRPDTNHHSTNG